MVIPSSSMNRSFDAVSGWSLDSPSRSQCSKKIGSCVTMTFAHAFFALRMACLKGIQHTAIFLTTRSGSPAVTRSTVGLGRAGKRVHRKWFKSMAFIIAYLQKKPPCSHKMPQGVLLNDFLSLLG